MVLWGLALAATALTAEGISSESALRSTQKQARSFIQALRFKHTLRVCNAYPLASGLDVYVGDSDIKLTVAPMPYKECHDWTPTLRAGDRVDFKIEDSSAGTFTISDLPDGDAVLLLVIYRHDTFSTAVAFQSHVFAASSTSQIAVLDTFKGSAEAKVHIQDVSPVAAQPSVLRRDEVLRFNSVVAVDPGTYALELQEAGLNATSAHQELVALPREAYVVIRCGVEAEDGDSHPQDLMIFPHSDKAALGASPRARSPGGAAAVALAVALLGAGTLLAAPVAVLGA